MNANPRLWTVWLWLLVAPTAGATNYVTETSVSIDRCASAWFIQRFVDPAATFVFIPPGAQPPAGITFGFFGSRYFNRGTDCTFTALVKARGLGALGPLQRMNAIVNDALSWQQGPKSLPVLLRKQIIDLRRSMPDDNHAVRVLMPTFDLLYWSCGGLGDSLAEGAAAAFDLVELRLLASGVDPAGQHTVERLVSGLAVRDLPLDATRVAATLEAKVLDAPYDDGGSHLLFADLASLLEGKSRTIPRPVVSWITTVSRPGVQRAECNGLMEWLSARKNLPAWQHELVRAHQMVWTSMKRE